MVVGVGFSILSEMLQARRVLNGQTFIEAPVSTSTESTTTWFKVMVTHSGIWRASGGASSASENVIAGPLVTVANTDGKLSTATSSFTMTFCRNVLNASWCRGERLINSKTEIFAGIRSRCCNRSYVEPGAGSTSLSCAADAEMEGIWGGALVEG